jgi:hypothetical protein
MVQEVSLSAGHRAQGIGQKLGTKDQALGTKKKESESSIQVSVLMFFFPDT